ncbi:MAG TPA: hypothetical protein VEZ16_08140 [Microvirga sp.]|nr:hypothetical protein [Microvirga sp.]
MPDTTVATGSFSSRRAADQAVQRLVTSGFARNSIELQRHPDDEGYDVMVHTRQDNLHRVQHLIEASPSAYAVRQAASGAYRSARAHPLLILGAGIVAGIGLYTLFSQNGRSSDRSGRRVRRRGR